MGLVTWAFIVILAVAIKILSTYEGDLARTGRRIPDEAVPTFMLEECSILFRLADYISGHAAPLASMTICPTVVDWNNPREAEAAKLCMEKGRSVSRTDGMIDFSAWLFDVETTLITRSSRHDEEPLEVTLLRNKRSVPNKENAPLIVFIHGGGFTTRIPKNSLATKVFHTLQKIDAKKNSAVLEHATLAIIDYRLAPEFPYPAATQDCMLALEHLVLHMGLGRGGVHIFGISAGGLLAVELTFNSLSTLGIDVDSLVVSEPKVLLPAEDGKWTLDSPSLRRYAHSRLPPVTWLEWSTKAYTGMETDVEHEQTLQIGKLTTNVDIAGGSTTVSNWIDVFHKNNLSRLPKIFLITGKGDPLRGGGLYLKDVFSQVYEDLKLPNIVSHADTSSGHGGYLLFEPGVYHNVMTQWYDEIQKTFFGDLDLNETIMSTRDVGDTY
mmetsp:Transcript_19665/g.46169  ORF Transcript_19665/g.46169 Transcript_19665/m.46169 type:complete len:439 (+) Transcript_19665:462-1778(+)